MYCLLQSANRSLSSKSEFDRNIIVMLENTNCEREHSKDPGCAGVPLMLVYRADEEAAASPFFQKLASRGILHNGAPPGPPICLQSTHYRLTPQTTTASFTRPRFARVFPIQKSSTLP